MSAMRLSTIQIDTLRTLYVMQPATTTAISAYLGNSKEYSSGSLPDLMERGLVERIKAPRGPKATAEERAGDVDYVPQIGKRPYLYRLTEAGLRPAYHYQRAHECLNEETDDANDKQHTRPQRVTLNNL